MDNKIFIYRDAKGNITSREVINISETEIYIQCICLKAGALRTFRKDRILEFLDDHSLEKERLRFHKDNNPAPVQNNTGVTHLRNTTGKLEICFTGFKKSDKDRLVKLAIENDLFIRSSVTKNLTFLCCGYNAGPKKIEKSRHQGVIALSENQLITMLNTGEIPEEV